jgi:sugar O-acyltransferase (sialic acid O-acetyltransferase NeuD family)
MTPRLLIVGAGAQARYVLETVARTGSLQPIGLIDTFDNTSLWGQKIDGVAVLGGCKVLSELSPSDDLKLVLAIGDVAKKQAFARQLIDRGFSFTSIVHPAVIIARNVKIGMGSIINAGTIIERGSGVGAHVIVHAGCVIEHDNVLEDFVNFGPGVTTAGRVRIERAATVFTGARLTPGVTVGTEAVVGAGAVVLSSVAPRTTVAGVPARIITANRL